MTNHHDHTSPAEAGEASCKTMSQEPRDCFWCDGNGYQREFGGDQRCNPCDGTGSEQP